MHHARCGRTLEYLGLRARVELDFYCPGCFEHVSVPECTLPHIPVAAPGGHAARVVPLTIEANRPRRIDRTVDTVGARPAA